jgi:hypothetical protein
MQTTTTSKWQLLNKLHVYQVILITLITFHGNVVDGNTSTTMIIVANIKEVSFTIFKGIGADHDEELS